jgi:hypothetical protein
MDTAPLPFPSKRSKRAGKSELNHSVQAFLFLLGIVAVIFSGWLGVQSAKLRQRPETRSIPDLPETSVTRTADGDSVYLAESASALRRFFVTFPTASERANAQVESYQIRKLRGNLEMRTLRAEGDVVEVEISGEAENTSPDKTVFWIHHSQMPAATSFDPIIPPIPQ